MPTMYLTEADQPGPRPVPTLGSLVQGLGLPEGELAGRLGLSAAGVRRRLQQSTQWSVADLQRLGSLLGQSLGALATLIAREQGWEWS